MIWAWAHVKVQTTKLQHNRSRNKHIHTYTNVYKYIHILMYINIYTYIYTQYVYLSDGVVCIININMCERLSGRRARADGRASGGQAGAAHSGLCPCGHGAQSTWAGRIRQKLWKLRDNSKGNIMHYLTPIRCINILILDIHIDNDMNINIHVDINGYWCSCHY